MVHQIDCFKIHLKFFKFLGIWCSKEDQFSLYKYYSRIIVTLFVLFYIFLVTLNFYFIERNLDSIVEEMILYFTLISIISKVLTFIILHEKIANILAILESDIFQPNEVGAKILLKTKYMNRFYWRMFAITSVTSNLCHALVPLILHLIFGSDLYLPVCNYAFISEELIQRFIYPLYMYQFLGIHINMWYNVNVDSFFLGLMNLTVAQLEILDEKLRNVTGYEGIGQSFVSTVLNDIFEEELYSKLKQCFVHYRVVSDFCKLVEDTFSITLFIQFNIASCVICVCLFRLTLPTTPSYFIFLSTYILIMVLQILIPCWFGHQITDKSAYLVTSIYHCEWESRPRRFTNSLRFFLERAGQPLTITGWKIFPLSLTTFTSIANTAYSFFTLLRNVQVE